MSGKHFTIEDRVLILQGVTADLSIRKIAAAVSASPSTVSRELKNIAYFPSVQHGRLNCRNANV